MVAEENAPIDANQTKRADFRYSIGIAVANVPYFDASVKSHLRVLPYGDLRYKALFLSPFKGLGVDLPLGGGAVFSPSISWRGERKESYDKTLKGLGDIDAEATYGASISFMRPNFTAGANFFRGFSSGASTYAINAGFPFRLGESWTIAPGVSAQFGDRKYNRIYYGINQTQAAASRYDRYKPSDGLVNISASLMAYYGITQRVGAAVFVSRKYFVDQAAASPFIKAEDDEQNNFGAMILYRGP
jgi:outer membrane scaffolding protein for murein synthesis (MipA/OmpV family)